jgi:ankyrin repeat protein
LHSYLSTQYHAHRHVDYDHGIFSISTTSAQISTILVSNTLHLCTVVATIFVTLNEYTGFQETPVHEIPAAAAILSPDDKYVLIDWARCLTRYDIDIKRKDRLYSSCEATPNTGDTCPYTDEMSRILPSPCYGYESPMVCNTDMSLVFVYPNILWALRPLDKVLACPYTVSYVTVNSVLEQLLHADSDDHPEISVDDWSSMASFSRYVGDKILEYSLVTAFAGYLVHHVKNKTADMQLLLDLLECILVKVGADPNRQYSGDVDAALVVVCAQHFDGLVDVVQLLLNHGADPNIQSQGSGHCTVLRACMQPVADTIFVEHVTTVIKTLAPHGANLDLPDNMGRIALTMLFDCVKGQTLLSAASVLLESGASPDVPTRDEKTPLMLALCVNDSDLVNMLLEHKANPNMEAPNGLTALQYAVSRPRGFNHLKGMELVLPYADPNVVNSSGNTVLMMVLRDPAVAHCGHQEDMFMLLLANDRLDPSITDKSGQTPLMVAAQKGALEQASALWGKLPAHMHMRDNEGMSAYMHAAMCGHVHVMHFLASMGAHVEVKDGNGLTVLVLVCGQSWTFICCRIDDR